MSLGVAPAGLNIAGTCSRRGREASAFQQNSRTVVNSIYIVKGSLVSERFATVSICELIIVCSKIQLYSKVND